MPKRKLDEVEDICAFAPVQMKTQVGPKHLGDPRFMKEIYGTFDDDDEEEN